MRSGFEALHLHFKTPEAALSRLVMAVLWCRLFCIICSFGLYFYMLLLFLFKASNVKVKKPEKTHLAAVHCRR